MTGNAAAAAAFSSCSAAATKTLVKHWVKHASKKKNGTTMKTSVASASISSGGAGEGGKIGIIELSSPSNRNALSTPMLTELRDAIQLFLPRSGGHVDKDEILSNDGDGDEDTSNVRALIIQSTPESPAFSSGHDLKELQQYQRNQDSASIHQLFTLCSSVMTLLSRSPIPTIAAVDGVATAAGCQLVASCDLAYATERSRFATPGVKIGLFCSTPAVALARCVSRKHAMEMLLTGEMISATKAYQIGLVNDVLSTPEDLQDKVHDVANRIATQSSPGAIAVGKPGFGRQLESTTLEEAYDVAGDIMCRNVMDEECLEGIEAFLEKRPPDWDVSRSSRSGAGKR